MTAPSPCALRAEALDLLGRLEAAERRRPRPDMGGIGYTQGVIARIAAGEAAPESWVAGLRAAVAALEPEPARPSR